MMMPQRQCRPYPGGFVRVMMMIVVVATVIDVVAWTETTAFSTSDTS